MQKKIGFIDYRRTFIYEETPSEQKRFWLIFFLKN